MIWSMALILLSWQFYLSVRLASAWYCIVARLFGSLAAGHRAVGRDVFGALDVSLHGIVVLARVDCSSARYLEICDCEQTSLVSHFKLFLIGTSLQGVIMKDIRAST